MLLFLANLAFADCPATSVVVDQTLDAAEAAYLAMDLASFRGAVDAAVADAACLEERPPRATIAELHRFVGLRAFFVDHDTARAASAFAAARALEPAYRFPESVVPPGHSVLEAYVANDPSARTGILLPEPASGHMEVDGTPSITRPAEGPALVQVVGDDGSVAATAYLWAADPLPPYPIAPSHTNERKGPNRPLAAAAGVSVAVAGVTYALAYSKHGSFYDPATPTERLESLRVQNNTLFATSMGVGVIAVGTGVAAVIAGRW